MSEPLFRKIDCLRLYVPDIEAALDFYQQLGHALVWRSETAAGLRLPDNDAELVLQTERAEPETDLLVESVPAAIARFVNAGGRVLVEPFEIQIGKCAVIQDPFKNTLVILDASKGFLTTDAQGNITGNAQPKQNP